jgi:hypothetical protein
MFIFDCHVHLPSPGLKMTWEWQPFTPDLPAAVRYLRRCGVDRVHHARCELGQGAPRGRALEHEGAPRAAHTRIRRVGIGGEQGLGPAGRSGRHPVDGDAGLAEVAAQQPPGPLQHDLQIHGGEDGLDGLLDDAAMDVVLGEDGEHGGDHGAVDNEIWVPTTTNLGCGPRRAAKNPCMAAG